MMILAIDPGPEKSGWVVYDTDPRLVLGKGHNDNGWLIRFIQGKECPDPDLLATVVDVLVIEQIKSYGQVMGDSCLETCMWYGRFIQAWGGDGWHLIPRTTIRTEITGHPRQGGTFIRRALLDRFRAHTIVGGGKEPSYGTKRQPGPLYGVTSHMMSALAAAVAWYDINQRKMDNFLR